MARLFARWLLSVLGAVLAFAPSADAQTNAPSGLSFRPPPVPEVRLPTDPTVDLLYTPVTPCRIVDTRVAGGPIAGGTTRNFVVTGTTLGPPAQGGTSGGCGIPAGAPAALINYVAVGPAGPGDLRVTATGTPVPLASILNYTNISGLNIANGVITPLFTGALAFHITVQADVSATDLVADVLGYFREVSCNAGTFKVRGQCYEASLRSPLDVFEAGDACRAAGGRLAASMELRSLRGGNPLTLDASGEWTDSILSVDNVNFFSMIIANDSGFSSVVTTTPHPFRCVFHPLP